MQKVFGKNPARATLMRRPRAVKRAIFLQGKSLSEHQRLACKAGITAEVLAREEFERLGSFAPDENHQGIFLLTEPLPVYCEKDLRKLAEARVVIALDQISNPQNLGTILRNAAFFGADAVVWLKNRSAELSSTAIRVAVGGAEFTRLYSVINLARSLETLKEMGFWIYGLDERGEKTLAQTDFDQQAVLVFGAEGEGLREKTKKHCDFFVRIVGGQPGIESLNVGVSTAVALGEVFRGEERERAP